jgi:hypothetical protein
MRTDSFTGATIAAYGPAAIYYERRWGEPMTEWRWGVEFLPGLAAAVFVVAYCWRDIARRPPRRFSRLVWMTITAVSIPLGALAYLVWGRGALPPEGVRRDT